VTHIDRKKLDEALDTFEKFMDFVKFANDHNIIFDLDEWEEYRDKVQTRVDNHDDEISEVYVDVGGLILPM
jgi:hypothetical protein